MRLNRTDPKMKADNVTGRFTNGGIGMLTFLKEIDRLMTAEGFEPEGEHGSEAKDINENLIYITNFCRENGIKLTRENVEGILIANWSLIGESGFTCPVAVTALIDAVLKAL